MKKWWNSLLIPRAWQPFKLWIKGDLTDFKDLQKLTDVRDWFLRIVLAVILAFVLGIVISQLF